MPRQYSRATKRGENEIRATEQLTKLLEDFPRTRAMRVLAAACTLLGMDHAASELVEQAVHEEQGGERDED